MGKNQQWFIVAAPLSKFPHLSADLTAESTIIWLIKDQNNDQNNIWLISELFKLTLTEAKVLELLLLNMSPTQIAEQLAIKISTIRTHLASLLTKTHSKRQQDLIHMAATFDFFNVEL